MKDTAPSQGGNQKIPANIRLLAAEELHQTGHLSKARQKVGFYGRLPCFLGD